MIVAASMRESPAGFYAFIYIYKRAPRIPLLFASLHRPRRQLSLHFGSFRESAGWILLNARGESVKCCWRGTLTRRRRIGFFSSGCSWRCKNMCKHLKCKFVEFFIRRFIIWNARRFMSSIDLSKLRRVSGHTRHYLLIWQRKALLK